MKRKKEEEGMMLLRCLECGHEEWGEEDILLEIAEMNGDPYPMLVCPKCGHDSMYPKKVCDRMEEQGRRRKRP